MRIWFAALIVAGALAACGKKEAVEVQAPPPPTTAPVANGLGPFRMGMTRTDLEALHFDYRKSSFEEQGMIFPVFAATVEGADIEIMLEDEGPEARAVNIATGSPAYETKEGAHVGSTLGELKNIYPGGSTSMGYAPEYGLFFTFNVENEGFLFRFDADALGRVCVEEKRGCPMDMDSLRSVRLVVA